MFSKCITRRPTRDRLTFKVTLRSSKVDINSCPHNTLRNGLIKSRDVSNSTYLVAISVVVSTDTNMI